METNFRGQNFGTTKNKGLNQESLKNMSVKDLEKQADANSMKSRHQDHPQDDGRVDKENAQLFSASDKTLEKGWPDQTVHGD